MRLIFEWDKKKAKANLQKHKISFDEAKTLFNDPLLLTIPDEYHADNEERYLSIGLSAYGNILVIVHTERRETEELLIIRIISCRKATASERRSYEEGHE